jgi:hypothetical protein
MAAGIVASWGPSEINPRVMARAALSAMALQVRSPPRARGKSAGAILRHFSWAMFSRATRQGLPGVFDSRSEHAVASRSLRPSFASVHFAAERSVTRAAAAQAAPAMNPAMISAAGARTVGGEDRGGLPTRQQLRRRRRRGSGPIGPVAVSISSDGARG